MDPDDRDLPRSDGTADLLSIYLREIGKFKKYTREQEAELARRIHAGDRQALESLVKANLRFVVNIAKKYHAQGLSLTDLINEGNIGLIEAAKRYDPDRGVKFITYAVWWIRQAIIQALAQMGGVVRLPFKQISLGFRVSRIVQELSQQLGREPTLEELAQALGVDQEILADILRATRASVSLDQPITDEEQEERIMPLEDMLHQPHEEIIEVQSIIENVEDLLDELTAKEKDIVSLHYGINRPTPMTLEEIGKLYNLTRERIRQIEAKAMNKLFVLAKRKRLGDHLN